MRVCFRSSVQPGLIDEYRRRHAAVWPEMLRALKDAGWNNYSLFLGRRRAPDGLRRVRRLRRSPGPDGPDRGQRPLAGRDGHPLRGRRPGAGPGLPAHGNLQPRGPVVRGQRRRGQPPDRKRNNHEHHRNGAGPARGARHRGPFVGLWQLRHPLQGVRHARHPADRPGEAGRRREGPRTDRPGAHGGAAHSVGQGG